MKKLIVLIIILNAPLMLSGNGAEEFRLKEKRFIRELYEQRRYFDAISEVSKLSVGTVSPEMQYFIYTSYYLAGQYRTVLNNLKPEKDWGDTGVCSYFLLSGTYLKSGMYHESYTVLKKYEYNELPEKYVFTMFLRRIEPLVLGSDFESIDNELFLSSDLLNGSDDYSALRKELLQYRESGVKSPAASALMSALIPGLGQLYSGYPGEALVSILSIAATAFGGYYAIENGHRGAGYTLVFFSGLFYAGNIYGAYNSAELRNSVIQKEMYGRLTSRYGENRPEDFVDFGRVFD